jgi:hypothetical protein
MDPDRRFVAGAALDAACEHQRAGRGAVAIVFNFRREALGTDQPAHGERIAHRAARRLQHHGLYI